MIGRACFSRVKKILIFVLVTSLGIHQVFAASNSGDNKSTTAILPEISVGYESLGTVIWGANFYIGPYESNDREYGFASFLCPVFQMGYDIIGKNFHFIRVGFLDRAFFDDCNGIRICYLYRIGQDITKKDNSVIAKAHYLTVGYVRKIDRLQSVSFDLGWQSEIASSVTEKNKNYFVVRLSYSLIIPTLPGI